jgi:hypothetical protein
MATHKPAARAREVNKTRSLLNGETKASGSEYRLPKYAKRIYLVHGIDVNNDVITVVVLRGFGRRQVKREEFYVIQYREINRVIDRNSRKVRQFSGIDAQLRMETEMDDVIAVLTESVSLAAWGI